MKAITAIRERLQRFFNRSNLLSLHWKENVPVKNIKPSNTEMRRQAEATLIERRKKAPPSSVTEADTRRLVHELEVHQIELEMQNEELEQITRTSREGAAPTHRPVRLCPRGLFHAGA